MEKRYQQWTRKLRAQLRNCKDRELRVKAELLLLVWKIGNVREGCERRGFSRKFYYKWFNRLKRNHFDIGALREFSRRPKNSPKQISSEIEKAIHWYARRHYGSRMIVAYLRREGIKVSHSTVCHVLRKRRKPSRVKASKIKPHRRRYELAIPGQRIQMDVKYVPELINGRRGYNYIAIDECTRWRFGWCYEEINASSTLDFLNRVIEAFPFPIFCIQTDNGFEFTYRLNPSQAEVIHPMDEWCRKKGIAHRCIPPGEKELNGKVERSHRIDEEFFYWKASTASFGAFNQQQQKWIKHYNEERLHGGLGFNTPKEKLLERQEALSKLTLSQNLEFMRLRFIKGKPKPLSKEEKLLADVELALKRLYAA